MFGRKVKLFSILGFSVSADASWLVVLTLVTWSLAEGVFRTEFEDYPAGWLWAMGLVGAIGLFVSVVFHELCHSLVARRYGLVMKGITLFIFGGVAEMSEEPASPKVEFMMAIAGPAASVLLSALLYGLHLAGGMFFLPAAAMSVLWWLAAINLLLAAFNMFPGFPLDGGRVLRAALWHWRGDLRWATRAVSKIGGIFGAGLMVLGVASFVAGNVLGGVWWFMIGWFIRSAAIRSYQHLLLRQALEGESVGHVMNPDYIAVGPEVALDHLVEDYMLKHHRKTLPVVSHDDGRLVGCVNLDQVKGVPREQWPRETVADLVRPCAPDSTIAQDEGAMAALNQMTRTHGSRLVTDDAGRLVGILTLKDLMSYLAIKMELPGGSPDPDLVLPTRQD